MLIGDPALSNIDSAEDLEQLAIREYIEHLWDLNDD